MAHRFLNPTSALIANTARLTPGQHVLLLNSDDPALARWAVEMAGPDGHVLALHSSFIALAMLRPVAKLELSDDVYPDPTAHGPADVILLKVPKGREHSRAYLWTAGQALRPGGSLYVAGPNNGGAKTVIKDAAVLFGTAPVLAYKSSHRIALALRPDTLTAPPDWTDPPPWEIQTFTITRPGGEYTIITQPGLFSADHLDDGTALLLDHMPVKPGEEVLDIGCGYGIIGLVAARAGAQVVMVDDNLLAVRCARASAAANRLAESCTVLPGDMTSPVQDRRFDLIVSNPPFHDEFATTTSPGERLVRESYDRLHRGGHLRLVANRFLAYDRVMQQIFGSVRTIAETERYRVLDATRR